MSFDHTAGDAGDATLNRVLDAVATATGHPPVRQLRVFRAGCPLHCDSNDALEVRQFRDGTITLSCRDHCSVSEILRGLGLAIADLFPRQTNNN